MYQLDTLELRNEIMAATELAAIAVLRLQNPAFDEVKLSEAYKIAGSVKWFRDQIRKGHITPIRRGSAKNSPIFYSRFEIAALKKACATLKFNDERFRKEGYALPKLHPDEDSLQ